MAWGRLSTPCRCAARVARTAGLATIASTAMCGSATAARWCRAQSGQKAGGPVGVPFSSTNIVTGPAPVHRTICPAGSAAPRASAMLCPVKASTSARTIARKGRKTVFITPEL